MFLVERKLGFMDTALYYFDTASCALPSVALSTDEEYLHVLNCT